MSLIRFFFILFVAAQVMCFAAETTSTSSTVPTPTSTEPTPQQISQPYIHPGVMVQKDNVWKGYDNMLHLGNSISLTVSIISPEGLTFPVGESIIYNRVASAFTAAGLSVKPAKGLEKPSLPMFSIMILVYPLSDGYSAFIEGRLTEQVSLDRLPLSEDALYQAITWEQKNLIVSNARQFNEMLLQTVDQIAKGFTDRYTFFAAHEQDELKPTVKPERSDDSSNPTPKKQKKPIVPFENNPPADKLKLR